MNWQDTVSEGLTGFLKIKRGYDLLLDPLAKEYGLTRIELEILLFLSHNPNCNTATGISEKKLFTKSHVSTALKHLEQQEMIYRFFDSDNRKTIYLTLQPKAFDVVRRGTVLQKEFYEIAMKNISSQEEDALLEIFDKIISNVNEALL